MNHVHYHCKVSDAKWLVRVDQDHHFFANIECARLYSKKKNKSIILLVDIPRAKL